MIVVEDLKATHMSKSASGPLDQLRVNTLEEPGRKVKQKRGLNRSILDQGWGDNGGNSNTSKRGATASSLP